MAYFLFKILFLKLMTKHHTTSPPSMILLACPNSQLTSINKTQNILNPNHGRNDGPTRYLYLICDLNIIEYSFIYIIPNVRKLIITLTFFSPQYYTPCFRRVAVPVEASSPLQALSRTTIIV